jgi:hypothetical protein
VAIGLTLAALLGSLGTGLCYWLLIHTRLGQKVTASATSGSIHATDLRIKWLDGQLGHIDQRFVKESLVAIFVIGLLRARPILGAVGAMAAAVTVAAGHVLRYHILNHPPFAVPYGTFPSEHVTAVAGCALGLLLVCPPRLRGLLSVACAAVVSLVSTQVQVLGWHRASDSIGAALLALACASGVAGALAWLRPGGRPRLRRLWPSFGLLAVGTLVGLVLAGIAAADGLGLRGGLDSWNVQHQVSIAALWLTVASIAAIFAAFVYILGDADLESGWRPVIAALIGRRFLRRGSSS